MHVSNFFRLQDYNDIPGIAKWSQLTNVYYNWQMCNSDNEKEQLNLSFASQKMPDVYTHMDKTTANKYGSQGALIDLAPLIKKYAPNIQSYINKYPDVKSQMETVDGKIYYIPQIDNDYKLAAFQMFMIRQDWLTKLGLPMPKTTDDWYNTLLAFKNNASTLGVQNMLPYSSYFNGNEFGWFDMFSWSWGMYGSGLYDNGKGQIVMGALQPEFKDVVQYMNRLYSAGLLDPDLDANKDNSTFMAKVTTNRVGIVAAGQGRLGTYNQAGCNFVPLMPPVGPTGKQGYGGVGPIATTIPGLSISINNKHAIETVKAVDYLFSKDGMMLFNFGTEGDTYSMVNGSPQYTDKIMKDPKLNSNQTLLKYVSPLYDFACLRSYDFEKAQLGPVIADYKAQMVKAGLMSGVKQFSLTSFPLTADQLNTLNPTQTDLNTYINESIIKFTKGQWTIAANYDDFVSNIKKYGSDTLVSQCNTAYQKTKSK